MRRIALVLAAAACPVVAGAQAYHPQITVDELTKWRTVFVDLGHQACDKSDVSADVSVVGSSKVGSGKAVIFEVTTYSSAWIYQGDMPAEVTLDSAALKLDVALEPHRTVLSTGGVRETGNFDLTPARLAKIAEAGRVLVRVQGRQGECTFGLSRGQQGIIHAFLRAEYPGSQLAQR
jgi:hypothetical protein